MRPLLKVTYVAVSTARITVTIDSSTERIYGMNVKRALRKSLSMMLLKYESPKD